MATNGELLARIDERTNRIQKDVTEMKDMLFLDHDRLGKVEGKVNGFAAAQLVFTTLTSSIAAWLGMRR